MSRSHGPLQPRRTAVRGGLLAFVLLLGACASGGGGGDGADADAPPDTRPVSQLSPAPCPAGTPTGVDCLHADVPLAAGGTAMARLLVARVAAPGSLAWRQPLLVLPDDPGSRSVTDLAGWRQVARQLGRDVVLVDRRGTGGSTPSLACPEADPTTLWVPSDKARADYLEGLAACRQRLVAAGTDPAAFGSTAAAADLEAVRAGLGVERWHVLAGRGSMGVAAALARSFPDTVASVTVDGSHTLAPGTDAVITADAIVAQVRADPALTAAWEGAVARAGQTPLRGKVDLAALQPGNRTPVPPGQWPTLAMDAAALRAALVAAAAHGDDLGALVIDAAAGNGDRAATALASRLPARPDDWAGGVAHTVTCAEGRAAATPVGEPGVLGAWSVYLFVAGSDVKTCDTWATTGDPVDLSFPAGLPVAVLLGATGPAGLPESALGVHAIPGPADCTARVVLALVGGELTAGTDPCGTGPTAAVGPGPTTTTTTSSTTTTTTTLPPTTTTVPETTTTAEPITTTTRPATTTTRATTTTTTRPPPTTTTTTQPPPTTTTTTTVPSTPATEGPEVTAEAVTVPPPTAPPAPEAVAVTVPSAATTTTVALSPPPVTTTTTTLAPTTTAEESDDDGGGRGGRGGRDRDDDWLWLEELLGLGGGGD